MTHSNFQHHFSNLERKWENTIMKFFGDIVDSWQKNLFYGKEKKTGKAKYNYLLNGII